MQPVLSAAVLLHAVLFPPAEERRYVCERYGFNFERPDDGWTLHATQSPPGALFSVSAFPKGSDGLPSVVVAVGEWDGSARIDAIRDGAAAKLESSGVRSLERGKQRVAGRDAHWVSGRTVTASGADAEVRYTYLGSEPYLYVLQCARGVGDRSASKALDTIVESFALSPPKIPEMSAKESQWRRLAERCGSEIDWCPTWEEAASRARRQKKLVLVVYENYTALDLPETLRSGPLMDPDFVALVKERFVAFRLGVQAEAPFRAGEVYGLSTHSWGSAFLFVRPDAVVVRETGFTNASALAEVARDVLEEGSSGPAAPGPAEGDRLGAAEASLRRGELNRAEKLLDGAGTPRGHLLKARRWRQLRRGDLALEELRAARLGADSDLDPEIAADEAVILMRLGRYAEAMQGFERVEREWPRSARVAEARFWLGAFERLRDGPENGTTRWQRLVEEVPDDRWAWKAAANLLGVGSLVNGGERLDWPEADLFASVARTRREALDPSLLGKAERDAVAYLLETQRADGSWINPMDGFSLGSNLYTTPVTALCGSSLLPFARDEAARSSVRKAIGYALERHRSGKLEAGPDLAGVYSIWSRTFVLRFFAECVRARVGDERDLSAAMRALVGSIEKSQHLGGGWPYVTLPGAPTAGGLDPSSSFLTAGVVLALLEARSAGATVSPGLLTRSLAFLDHLRQDDGTYRYMPDLPSGQGVHALA